MMVGKDKKDMEKSTVRPGLPDLPMSPGLMVPVGLKESKNDGMLSVPKNVQNHISLRTRYLEILLRRSHRQQVESALVMRQLTTKFGTKGKSAKKIFLQAFEDDRRKNNDKDSGCITKEEKERLKKASQERKKTSIGDTEQPRAPFVGKERPAAIVSDKQSSFVRYLMEIVQNELHRVGCVCPIFDRDKAIETAKRDYVKMTSDFQSGQVYNLKEIARDQTKDDTIVDSEDKMIARLKIYSRAFSAVILHFTALRPILVDIKRNYDSVLALRNQQMVELRIVKKGIAYKEKYIDAYMEDFRFECYGEMSEMEIQSYRLMRHIDKQDAAIKAMTDILNRLEDTLGEEHELRRDADDQKKMLTAEVNVHRKKLGMSLRTNDGAQFGMISEEIVDTGDIEEEEALSQEDPLILHAALKTCRKNLAETQSRLIVLEAEYEGVVPRRQFASLTLDKADLEIKHEALLESYSALQPHVQTLKQRLDKLIAERPIIDEAEEDEEEEEEDGMKDNLVEEVSGPPPIPLQYDNYPGRICFALANALGVPILSAEKEDDPLGDTEVNMQQFYKAIIAADPDIGEERVATAIAWVFVGIATPSGQERKGLMLLNYVKSKLNLSMEDQEMSQLAIEFDDEDFERAIRAITLHLPIPEEEAQLTIQQKRQYVKKYKVTNISSVIKRVKDAPFLRYAEVDDDIESSSRHIRYSI